MKIVITGGTGFVGKHLTEAFISRSDTVYILTRSPEKRQDTERVKYIGWLKPNFSPEKELPAVDAIINLAGDSLFGYWSKSKKEEIYESRMDATHAIINLIKKLPKKPEVLINASAVGYFGTSETKTFTEESDENGDDFLAEVTKSWETAALQARDYGVRTVIARFGVILGREGALPLMALPFRLFIGGKIGSGSQWVSWIHIKDVVGLCLFALDHEKIKDVLHVTAPEPVQNKELSQVLANSLKRPNWLPAPAIMLKMILGDMSILVVKGQKVIPEKALSLGYSFQYPTVDKALADIYNRDSAR